MDRDEFQRQMAEYTAQSLAAFPYRLVEVPGADALAAWDLLKAEGQGIPVILGDGEGIRNLLNNFHPSARSPGKAVPDVLDAAARLEMPRDLLNRRNREEDASVEMTAKLIAGPDSALPKIVVGPGGGVLMMGFGDVPPGNKSGGRLLTPDETRAYLARQEYSGPDIGEWPTEVQASTGLTVATNLRTGKPFDMVRIVVLPTDDWTTAPAHLRWGDWNDCPAPEYHVAALRSWRDRYDVELVGLNSDTMNLRAARRPETREEALALAREQYAYCTDIVEQGTQTLSALAAALMCDDWWFFWWD
jgi:hypothetical protein